MSPLDEETARLVRGFEDGTLAAFPHEAHVRVAWAYARTLPLLEAIARMSEGLRRFAAAQGVPGKYHATITWAFVFVIHERVARAAGGDDWAAFARAHGDLFERSLLLRYYDAETLDSPLARRVFVLPQRALRAASRRA